MVMTSKTLEPPVRRKRTDNHEGIDQPKRKVPKREPSAALIEDGDSVQTLEHEIIQSRENYNKISILLRLAQNSDSPLSCTAIYSLCRVFCRLLASGALESDSRGSNEAIVSKWLRERLDNVWRTTLERLPSFAVDDQKHCIQLLMRLLKEDASSSNKLQLHELEEVATLVLKTPPAESTQPQLVEFYLHTFATKYLDAALSTVRGISTILEKDYQLEYLDPIITSLTILGTVSPQHHWAPAVREPAKDGNKRNNVTAKALVKAVGEAWLAVMATKPPKARRKVILQLIPKKIAPLLRRPEKLLDFLVDSFDTGGSTALSALAGLFYLIEEKNLDYPRFYHKLYSMLDASILHSKHRSGFLRLLERFLASTHLPAALVASFIKRLSRLCLHAPPAAIAYIVPFIYNLFKAHPSCTFMIHRQPAPPEGIDPFNMHEEDPMETGALESSIWEIHTLQDHYHPNVAVISRIISEQFTKPMYSLEDFLDHSYASMLESDLHKPLKRDPVVEYQIPKHIFPCTTSEDVGSDDVLALWGFDD